MNIKHELKAHFNTSREVGMGLIEIEEDRVKQREMKEFDKVLAQRNTKKENA